jgi:hypothetical protein
MESLISLTTAMLGVLATWAVLALLFTGIGLGLRRVYGLRRIAGHGCLLSFWLGFSLTIGFLQVWHLWFPIRWPAFAVVATAGLVGLALNGAPLGAMIRRLWRPRLRLVLLLLVSLWLANRAIGPCWSWDSRVYHLHVVQWSKAYPVVPGLGNLHDRLAFNNASLLYAAMLDIGPWSGRSNHVANGLLLLAMYWQILPSAFRLADRQREKMAHDVFNLVLLFPVVHLSMRQPIADLSTDVPVALMGLVVSWSLLRSLLGQRQSRRQAGFALFCLISISAASVCIKLSSAAFAALTSALALGIWLTRHRPGRKAVLANLAVLSAVTLGLLVPWSIRGVYLSGYPFFPATFGALPVDWRVPEEIADGQRRFVRDYARFRTNDVAYTSTEGRPWLRTWLERAGVEDQAHLVLPVLLALVFLILACICRFWPSEREVKPASGWVLLLAILPAIVFWFLMAPWARFAVQLFWALAATVAAITFHRHFRQTGRRLLTGLVIAWVVLVVVLMVVTEPHKRLWPAKAGPLVNVGRVFFHPPGPDHGLHPTPSDPLMAFRTDSGLETYAPDIGDDGFRRVVFASGLTMWVPRRRPYCRGSGNPLLTSPHLIPALELREAADLGAGFRIALGSSRECGERPP